MAVTKRGRSAERKGEGAAWGCEEAGLTLHVAADRPGGDAGKGWKQSKGGLGSKLCTETLGTRGGSRGLDASRISSKGAGGTRES